jgi:hypothetical protein
MRRGYNMQKSASDLNGELWQTNDALPWGRKSGGERGGATEWMLTNWDSIGNGKSWENYGLKRRPFYRLGVFCLDEVRSDVRSDMVRHHQAYRYVRSGRQRQQKVWSMH